MSDIKELKDEMLKEVAGGLDYRTMSDCDASVSATKKFDKCL